MPCWRSPTTATSSTTSPVDPRDRPRAHLSLRGQLLDLPGEEGRAARRAGPQGRQAAEAAGRGAGLGPLRREGAAGQEPGAPPALRGDGDGGRAAPQARLRGDPDPGRPAARQRRRRGREPGQGLRRPHADQGPVVLVAAQRHRRRHRPERRRQDHAVQDHRRAGGARLGVGARRRHRAAVLRRPEPGRDRPEEDGLAGRLRRARPHPGRSDGDAVARLRRGVRVQGAGPAEAGRRAVRRRAEPAQPRA